MRFTRTAWARTAGASVVLLALAGCAHGGEAGAVPAASNPPGEPARSSPAALPLPDPTGQSARSALDNGREAADELRRVADGANKKLRFTMPYVIGQNLQAAQDSLHAQGSYLLDEQDATGADRLQVLDRDWRVCSQSPASGQRVLITTRVVLKSVKLHEICPG